MIPPRMRSDRPDAHEPLSRRELAGVAVGVLALATAMTYPLVLFLPRGLPNDLGDPLLNTWTLAWVASRIPHAFHGVWDAPIFFPYRHTLAFSEHLIGVALFTAPVQWLSGNPIVAYNLAFLGSYVLAGVGMYLLVRHLTGRGDAAWIAGLAFAFHPYRVAQLPHLQVLMWGWMPVALWGLHRYFAAGSRRALAVFAAAFVLQALSNGYFFYFLSAAALIAVVFELARSRQRGRAVTDLAVAALAVFVVLAPVFDAYATVRRDYGLARSLDEIAYYSAEAASYQSVAAGLWWWSRYLPRMSGEQDLFPGLVVSALAVLGCWPSRGRRDGHIVALYATMGLVAFVFSLGPQPRLAGRVLLEHGPYEWLWRYLPGFDGLRVAARWATIVYLALATLGGLGARRLLAPLPRPAATIAAVTLSLAILVEGYGPVRVAKIRPEPEPDARAAYRWLRHAPPGAVLELPLGVWHETRPLVRELRYQYATLLHGKPLVNGFSGHDTPLHRFLLDSPVLAPPELAASVEALAAIGVRYIVVHLDEYDERAHGAAIVEALGALERVGRHATSSPERRAGPIVHHAAFGDVVVFRLADPSIVPPASSSGSRCRRRIGPDRFTVTASDGVARLPLAFDERLDTRWMSERAQRGDEWIRLEFHPPQPIALLRMEMEPYSWGDYPRELEVEVQRALDEGQAAAFSTVYRGPVLTQMMLGLLRDPDRAPIEIALPAVPLAALRLRQLGQAQPWYWSINELVLCTP